MVWTFSHIARRFLGSASRASASIHCSLASWHHQPGQLQLTAVLKAGSGLNVMPVEKTSQTSGLFRRCTRVAQSTTWRSILKPAASSCCLATSAFLYIHWYSLVEIQRTGCPVSPAASSRFFVRAEFFCL